MDGEKELKVPITKQLQQYLMKNGNKEFQREMEQKYMLSIIKERQKAHHI